MNKRDKYIKALTEVHGYKEVKSSTRKARTFIKESMERLDKDTGTAHLSRMYVGKSGSVRYGSVYSKSIPLSDGLKSRLLRQAEKCTDRDKECSKV